ncbi:zinc ribbon domain-containing protein [Pseudomonas sp. Y24-6]|uniref:zinc ribbon domain-containing protein n=1 Tax=Pseudomonas sp. Y24-6 TaxID=2750013 RepID=UPI001CE12591|nr:zinc ribbon domain-containing protein [Pseudomonas sp. Y24-6]MCA4960995.1 zinc ribbon domain-containing protein [Pseudomonas sp. Y24-6]
MQILIVILLAIIAISVAPWIVGLLALGLGAYGVVIAIGAGLAAALLLAVGLWHLIAMLRSDLKKRKIAEQQRTDLEKTLRDQAINALESKRRAEAREAEIALEADRKEQARVKRLVPCPHCASQIAKGSMFCPVCGKQPISTRPA